MSVTGPINSDITSTPPDLSHSPTGMHRPLHGEFDSEETACQDEVQRDSVLRTPR